MDFDNRKVYGDTSITDGLVIITENFKLTTQLFGPGNALLRGEVSLNQV